MNKKIKIALFMLAMSTISTFSMPCIAKASQTDIKVKIDDADVNFTDAKPFLHEGRTVIPVRAVSEALKADVTWDESTNNVFINKGNIRISMPLTGKEFEINDNGKVKKVSMDITPLIIDGRTYLPIRFISEAFGYNVEWVDWKENNTNSVYIHTKSGESYQKYNDKKEIIKKDLENIEILLNQYVDAINNRDKKKMRALTLPFGNRFDEVYIQKMMELTNSKVSLITKKLTYLDKDNAEVYFKCSYSNNIPGLGNEYYAMLKKYQGNWVLDVITKNGGVYIEQFDFKEAENLCEGLSKLRDYKDEYFKAANMRELDKLKSLSDQRNKYSTMYIDSFLSKTKAQIGFKSSEIDIVCLNNNVLQAQIIIDLQYSETVEHSCDKLYIVLFYKDGVWKTYSIGPYAK